MMMILVITMVIRRRRGKVHFRTNLCRVLPCVHKQIIINNCGTCSLKFYFNKNPLLTFSSIFVVCWSWLKGFALNLWGQTWPQKENASNKPLITGLSIAVSAGIIFKSRASTTQSGATVWTKLISNLHSARTIWYSSNWIDCTNIAIRISIISMNTMRSVSETIMPDLWSQKMETSQTMHEEAWRNDWHAGLH